MKKHDEGYTLPMVMVILLVISLVAVTIMTTSMNNMLRQQKFTQQMKDQYAAQGKIEEVVARLENATAADLESIIGEYTSDDSEKNPITISKNGEMKLTIKSVYESVTINCEMTLTGNDGNYQVKYDKYEISSTESGGDVDAD